jgi:peptidoglycan/LPS O-acetylase OafA/YrhL
MIKGSRTTYLVASWLFLAGVTAQVFLAGMVVVAAQMGWANHVNLGHSLALPLLVMLVTAYLGRMPGSLKRLTWLLFLVYILQADVLIFLRDSVPALAAFHPVLALADFALGLTLALRVRPLVSQSETLTDRTRQTAVTSD